MRAHKGSSGWPPGSRGCDSVSNPGRLPGKRRSSMWQADGWGWRARLGVLPPHHDPVQEAELWAMAPAGVSISAARVPLGWVPASASVAPKTGDEAARAFAEPPLVDDAAELLAAGPVQVIVY